MLNAFSSAAPRLLMLSLERKKMAFRSRKTGEKKFDFVVEISAVQEDNFMLSGGPECHINRQILLFLQRRTRWFPNSEHVT